MAAELKACVDAGLTARQAAAKLHMGRGKVSGKAAREGWVFGLPDVQRDKTSPPPRNNPHTRANPSDVQCKTSFSADMMLEIVKVGNRYNITRSEAVRMLVQWGLDSCR